MSVSLYAMQTLQTQEQKNPYQRGGRYGDDEGQECKELRLHIVLVGRVPRIRTRSKCEVDGGFARRAPRTRAPFIVLVDSLRTQKSSTCARNPSPSHMPFGRASGRVAKVLDLAVQRGVRCGNHCYIPPGSVFYLITPRTLPHAGKRPYCMRVTVFDYASTEPMDMKNACQLLQRGFPAT